MVLLLQRWLAVAAPEGVAIRSDGAYIAITDPSGHCIRHGGLPQGALASLSGYAQAPAQGLAFPEALAFDSVGDLLVSDLWNRRIVRFTSGPNGFTYDAAFPATAGLVANGVALTAGRDLVIDSQDRLYVLDTPNRRILRYAGGATNAIPVPAGIGMPWGLALSATGFFIADPITHRIWSLDATGALVKWFGGYGKAQGQLRSPQHVVVTDIGTVLVADADNRRIQEFDANGVLIGTAFEGPMLRHMRRLCIAPNGTLYIADPGAHAVLELAASTPARSLHSGRRSVDYGSIEVKKTATTEFSLRNEGTQPVQLASVKTSGSPFAVTVQGGGPPATLNPGGQRTLQVTFAPQSQGPATGSVVIESDAVPPVTSIPLAGLATPPPPSVGIVFGIDRTIGMQEVLKRLRYIVDLVLPVRPKPRPWPPDPPPADFKEPWIGIVSFGERAVIELPLTSMADLVKSRHSEIKLEIRPQDPPLGSIAEGLESAFASFDGAPVERKVVVLITDGRSASSGELDDLAIPDDVVVHAVALGSEQRAEWLSLARLVSRTGGVTTLGGTTDLEAVAALLEITAAEFGLHLATRNELEIWPSEGEADIPIDIAVGDQRFHIVVLGGPAPRSVSVELIDRRGAQRKSDAVTVSGGQGILHVSMLVGKPDGVEPGQWRLRVRSYSDVFSRHPTVLTFVESEFNLTLSPVAPLLGREAAPGREERLTFVVGDQVLALAQVQALDERVRLAGIDDLWLLAPHPDTFEGTSYPAARRFALERGDVASNSPPDEAEVGSSGVIPLSVHEAQFMGSPETEGKAVMAVLNVGSALVPGLHCLRIRARFEPAAHIAVTREAALTLAVAPEVSANHSDVQIARRGDNPTGEWRVIITPRDRYGHLLGPGWAPLLALATDGGENKLSDRGDGSYVGVTHQPGSFEGSSMRFVLRVDSALVPLPSPGSADWEDVWHNNPEPPLDVSPDGDTRGSAGVDRRPALG